jgi:lambda family phage minor tail protein L
MSRDSNHKVNTALFSLEPSALLEFFVIYYDYVNFPDEKLYIHGGTNGIEGSVYWQGEEYAPFPIQSSGFESKGDGSLPRPKLAVSNQDFFVSNLIRRYSNLVGAKVIRKRTFVKFLDDKNFSPTAAKPLGANPYGSADPKAGLEDQVFFILRRSSESKAVVEFELASPLELDGVNFPKRIVMSRYCSFHYRGNGCRYMGAPVADENDLKLSVATDFRAGLLKRVYTTTGSPASPVSSSEFTSKIAAATFSSESVVSSVTVTNDTYVFTEFLGYFKVDKGQAGSYSLGVDPDDAAELFIDGDVIAGDYGSGPQNTTAPQEEGTIFLKEGYHRVLIRWYNQGGGGALTIYYKPPAVTSWAAVPVSRYYYDVDEASTLTSSQRFGTDSAISKYIGINESSFGLLVNKDKWISNYNYKVGDYVYRENHNIKVTKSDINAVPNWEPIHKVFVCAKNHTSTSTKDPYFNKEYWIPDQCSKSIKGCKLRFGNQDGLPFGGFPGTEEYGMSQQ